MATASNKNSPERNPSNQRGSRGMSRKNAIKAMKTKLTIAAVGVVLAATALPMLAHHAFTAEFDASRPLSLTGTFTKMEFACISGNQDRENYPASQGGPAPDVAPEDRAGAEFEEQ